MGQMTDTEICKVIDNYITNTKIDDINYDDISKKFPPCSRQDFNQKLAQIISIIITECLSTKNNINYDYVIKLETLVKEYAINNYYKVVNNSKLYTGIAQLWMELGDDYDEKAIEALKKYILYAAATPSSSTEQDYKDGINTESNFHYSNINAFRFRSCNEYLFKDLINDELNLSAPQTFNDPFDCPILALLKYKGGSTKFASLLIVAYYKCLKIACFSSRYKLPYYKTQIPNTLKKDEPINSDCFPVTNELKQANAKEEFKNLLMWGHYADSHKGICIKYNLKSIYQGLYKNNPGVFACFKDIKYSDEEIVELFGQEKNFIRFYEAFYLKKEIWKYEDELRYLYFDTTNNDNYLKIKIPNSIEAIYFGLNCSAENKDTIMKIMKDKKFVIKDGNGNKQEETSIAFYQMEISEDGNIEEKKIK